MRIAILGTGTVGRHLAAGLRRHGHDTVIGTRDPAAAKAAALAQETGAPVRTFADAVDGCDLAVLATLWAGTAAAVAAAGADRLAGRILVDATNPLDVADGAPRLALGFSTSGAEQIQAWAPRAKVVKAWNTVTAALMVDPRLAGGPPDMFFCGDDAPAKAAVAGLLAAVGWNPVDIGGLAGARLLEPLAMLWITHALRTNGWDHAFKLIRPA